MKALSIRQPWAWLIVNGFKDIENRSWNTKFRGPVLIHASSAKVSHVDWQAAGDILAANGHTGLFPLHDDFELGGIVGVASITGTCESSSSPWFFGPVGFQLKDAKPLPFIELRGRLSFFDTQITATELGAQAAYAGLAYHENPFVDGDNVVLPHSDDWQRGFLSVRAMS